VPYGVAVWEIADGDGQRARNRWASHGIIKGSQKVTMNYFKFALQTQYTKNFFAYFSFRGPQTAITENKRRSLTPGYAKAGRTG